MSGRRIELSVIQVVSSVLAAVTGAIVASSLGVAGTVIGVAVVSFATTAGTAIYRHYLGRTQERLRSAAAAMGHLGTATAGQTRPAHWGVNTAPMAGRGHGSGAAGPGARQVAQPGDGQPSGGMPGGGMPGDGMPGGGRAPDGASPGSGGGPVHETWVIPVQVAARLRAEAGHTAGSWPDGAQPPGAPGTPGDVAPGSDAPEGGEPGRRKLAAVLDWARTERWPKFAAVAVMIFALAMGGITILEAATGRPLDALIWGAHNSGTTVGNVVSGPAHRSRHPRPGQPSGTPTPHPTASHHSATPTPSPRTSTPTPRSTQPTPTPTTHTPSPSATPTPAASHSPTTPAAPPRPSPPVPS
jgi:hypothetical protein